MVAAEKWEKSLIFCERNETIDSLHREIETRWMDRLHAGWERMYPGLDMEAVFGAGSRDERKIGIFQRWATRFTRGQDELSVALRKSYPHTLFLGPEESELPAELWNDAPALVAGANDVLRSLHSAGTAQPASTTGWRCGAWMLLSPGGSSGGVPGFSINTAVCLNASSPRTILVLGLVSSRTLKKSAWRAQRTCPSSGRSRRSYCAGF